MSKSPDSFVKIPKKVVRWCLVMCFSILFDFARFSYDRVFGISNIFQQTCLYLAKLNKFHNGLCKVQNRNVKSSRGDAIFPCAKNVAN